MANANRPSSVEQCIADITECSICNEVLQDNRCLPCLHTFCLQCLETYRRGKPKGKTIPCPVCRRELSIPKCVASLPRNFFIDKLIDAHKVKTPDVLPNHCEICFDDTNVVPATRFCCDCRQNICLACEKQHKKTKAITWHKIIDSTGVTDSLELAPRPTYCIAHTTKEAEVYCQECKMVICWKCKCVTHFSHTSIEISSAGKDLSKKLEKHVEEISEHVRNKEDDIRKLTEREKSYTNEIDAESANICRELNKLYGMITENGDKLKKALNTSTAVNLSAIHSLRVKLETDVNELKKHKVYIEQMIHLGNVSDLCEYTDMLISETSRKAAANSYEIIVPTVPHLSDLNLQNLLIGTRTDIDEQYKRKSSEEQLQDDLHPNKYSKEDSSKVERHHKIFSAMRNHSDNVGIREDIEKKPSSNEVKGSLNSVSLPMLNSRDNAIKFQSKAASVVIGVISLLSPGQSFGSTYMYNAAKMIFNRRPTLMPERFQRNVFAIADVEPSTSGERFPKYKNGSLERTISLKDDGAVCGITILDSKLYTVLQNNSSIQVYDSDAFVFLNDFTVDGLVNPNDITSCKFNNCLYICDWGSTRIFRVKIGEQMRQMNWSIDGDLGCISVTVEHNVLLAGHRSSKLKEYTSEGNLLRSVSLEDGLKPWHAIRLVSNDFLICQGENSSGHHRVCLAGSNGKLNKSFGGDMGSGEAHMCGPYHLAVDKNGCILVNDCNNSRILLLSYDLQFIKEVIPSSANVLRRVRRMYLDEVADRLYVADNETTVTGSETKDGRLLVFSFSQVK